MFQKAYIILYFPGVLINNFVEIIAIIENNLNLPYNVLKLISHYILSTHVSRKESNFPILFVNRLNIIFLSKVILSFLTLLFQFNNSRIES